MNIDDVRAALAATCAALELRIAARASSASAGLLHGPSGAPHELPGTPAGTRTGVEPPWE